jgi:hypothetical protein
MNFEGIDKKQENQKELLDLLDKQKDGGFVMFDRKNTNFDRKGTTAFGRR